MNNQGRGDWDTPSKPSSRSNTQGTSQHDRGCFKCGGPHLEWVCRKRDGGSSRVVEAQVEIKEEEEEEEEEE